MAVARFALWCGAAAFVACVRPAGECNTANPCPGGQTCHLRYGLCYAAGPTVAWASPAVGQVLTGSSATISGVIGLDGAYDAVEVSIGRPDVWQPLAVSAAGQFTAAAVLPTSDGLPQPVRIRVTEPQATTGLQTVVSIYRVIDNVAPSLSFSEPGLRSLPTTVRVVASEPLDASAPPPSIARADAPALTVGGAWNSDGTEIRYEGLEHDATYVIDIPQGTLTDRAGNPTDAALQLSFTTEPVTPLSDQTVAIDGLSLTDLEVASDPEGAVSVVLSSAQGSLVWGEFDARTGLFRRLTVATGAQVLGFQPVGAPMPNARWPDGTSQRANGYAVRRQVGATAERAVVYADVYGSAPRGALRTVQPGAIAYAPGPGSCAEPASAGTLEVNRFDGLVDFRNASGAVRVPMAPASAVWTLFQSGTSTEWLALDSGSLSRFARTCACSPAPGCTVAGPMPIDTNVTATASLSAADTVDGQRAYVYDVGAVRTMRCLKQCPGPTCALAGSETAIGTERSVASRRQGSLILQADRVASGDVVLSERSLAQGCPATAPVELGRLPAASITRFRPAMFGRSPGLVYLSNASGPGVLRTYIP